MLSSLLCIYVAHLFCMSLCVKNSCPYQWRKERHAFHLLKSKGCSCLFLLAHSILYVSHLMAFLIIGIISLSIHIVIYISRKTWDFIISSSYINITCLLISGLLSHSLWKSWRRRRHQTLFGKALQARLAAVLSQCTPACHMLYFIYFW